MSIVSFDIFRELGIIFTSDLGKTRHHHFAIHTDIMHGGEEMERAAGSL